MNLAPNIVRLAKPLFEDVAGDIDVSFEFFPPKTEKMEETLWESVKTLEPLAPRFVSVTYGAGGSTRARTHATVERIARETTLNAAAHLTCVEASRAEIDDIAREYWAAGVRHIVALRGDPPNRASATAAPGRLQQRGRADRRPEGDRAVRDLGRRLSGKPPGLAQPRRRPRQPLAQDRRRRDRAITQFFFTPECFFRFRDHAAAMGIDAEIVPGILPVSNVAQTRKFAAMCGASIPSWMDRLFEGLDNLPAARQLVAATVAAELCGQLYAGGVRHFHFYTLNRAELAYAICHLLGLRPKEQSVEHRRTA
jgi:methylenetetrahydrofolate reductase (NADPH)